MRLKDKVEHEFGVPVRVRAGAPGSLNVLVNGERIFSKKESGRLPNPEEIIRLIREKAPQA